MTQNQKLVDYLTSNTSINSTTARKKLGIRNLRAHVNELRMNGVCVFTSRTDKGTTYMLGSPTPSIVATAYQVAGSSLFTTTVTTV